MIQQDRLSPLGTSFSAEGQAWMRDELSPREKEEAKLLAETISIDDSTSVVRFGTAIQQEFADFASSVLTQVRASDAGDLGGTITELVTAIQASKSENDERRRLLASIPAVGRLLKRVRHSLNGTKSLEEQVEVIRSKLDESYLSLQKDIEMLDMVLNHNFTYFKKLDVHIAAAQLRLKQAYEDLSVLKQADPDSDPWATEQVSVLNGFIHRLELRIDDFRRTRHLSLTQAPRIRLLQQGEQLMMEKIQSVIFNLIPLWKMDLVTGLAQQRASRAMVVHNQVRDRIELSMRESAEQTRRLSVNIARESEGGIIGMDTLRNVQDELLATLSETITVYADGRRQRLETEQELASMERELKLKIAEVAQLPMRQ